MSIDNNHIKSILNIKDDNITFEENFYSKKRIKYVETHIYEGKLSYTPKGCPKCGILNSNQIVKYGFKSSRIKLQKISDFPTLLILKKQRFLCKCCNSTFIAKTNLVSNHCFISNNVKKKISSDIIDTVSFKYIARINNVSISTVTRVFKQSLDHFQPNYNYLPESMCFDEFKSVKSVDSAMSFIFCDAQTSKIIDILPDRKLSELRKYFSRYSRKARYSVKSIVCDMYKPYMVLAKELFPNAKIIIDKFHVVQNFNRAFNITRVQVMKKFKTDSHEYRTLKRYWKLLLKPKYNLNSTEFRPRYCFKQWVSERCIVDHMLSMDEGLKSSYELLQDIHMSIKLTDSTRFDYILNKNILNSAISEKMRVAIKTGIENIEFIENMMTTNLTNARIEGIINKIKMIKRVSFGFRKFSHLKLKIQFSFYLI